MDAVQADLIQIEGRAVSMLISLIMAASSPGQLYNVDAFVSMSARPFIFAHMIYQL